MNLLPFVFTFLLLLSLMSSLMFSSAVRTSREQELITSHHDTYLSLLSKQHKSAYEQKREKPKTASVQKKEAAPAKNRDGNFRDAQKGAEGSKLHLYTMIHGRDEHVRHAVMECAARLLEEVYGETDFYKLAKGNPAEVIVQAMHAQKIRRFEELKLDDAELDQVYYRMLQGTSSSYPPLSEYCLIGKREEKPIRFRFASSTVMRAVLGRAGAEKLFEQEAKKGQEGGRRGPLTKKEFLAFLKAEAGVEMDGMFDYENKRKGVPQSQKDGRGKMRATRYLVEGMGGGS